jgi:hypothetical protein
VPKDPVPKKADDSALTTAIMQRKKEIEKAAAPPEVGSVGDFDLWMLRLPV